MEISQLNLKIVIILTFGFGFASILGYFSQRIKLSPILGYLLAGYIIGPFSPGYVADLQLAEQLAEVGVMLMMYGVGLHFKWQDLLEVKNIALPGAIGQTIITATASAFIIHSLGGAWHIGIMIGLAIGVASTVVLVRVLSDQKLLDTQQGHIAIGWLVVEDILTIMVLILLPTLVAFISGHEISFLEISGTMILILVKFILLAGIMFTFGKKIVSFLLHKVAQTRSQELFTLSIFAIIFFIATGSSFVFGTSIALGAFIAGMVIGQTTVSHQASAYASPLKDAFVVIFFLSVGMLFNPLAIGQNPTLFLSILSIILIVKPLAAFIIVKLFNYSVLIALTISVALAQIGEFSFILAEEALKYHIFTDEAYDIIVACALISISLNPLLFKFIDLFKASLKEGDNGTVILKLKEEDKFTKEVKALVIGFGLIGQMVVDRLEKNGIRTLIIDRNVEAVTQLLDSNREAIFGDASFPNMLEIVKIELARILIITIPDLASTIKIVKYAKQIHPEIIIIARVPHKKDESALMAMGVKDICCDEELVKEAFEKIINEKLINMTHPNL